MLSTVTSNKYFLTLFLWVLINACDFHFRCYWKRRVPATYSPALLSLPSPGCLPPTPGPLFHANVTQKLQEAAADAYIDTIGETTKYERYPGQIVKTGQDNN